MIDPLNILLGIAQEKSTDGKWHNKPLYLIKIMPNSTKGDLGEMFILKYCTALGFDVAEKHSRLGDYDVKINKKTFEVKMATEDISGHFQFNHIRYDYKYDFLLCLGISPEEILFEIYTKSDLVTGKAGSLVSMGRGQNSSFKLTKAKSALRHINEFKEAITEIT